MACEGHAPVPPWPRGRPLPGPLPQGRPDQRPAAQPSDADTIRLRYKDNLSNPPKRGKVDLTAGEFVRRFLDHVPEPGQHLVRSYGLFAPSKRAELDAAPRNSANCPWRRNSRTSPGRSCASA